MARTKQIIAEVAAALAQGKPHPEATVADWKKLIKDIQSRSRRTRDEHARALLQHELDAANDGLKAAMQKAAHKPGFVTGVNLFALTKMVIEHGPEFPNRFHQVDMPHIKRCFQAGLLEEVGGRRVRLTPTGREVVGDELIKDIARENAWKPRINDDRQEIERGMALRDARLKDLEAALAKLR